MGHFPPAQERPPLLASSPTFFLLAHGPGGSCPGRPQPAWVRPADQREGHPQAACGSGPWAPTECSAPDTRAPELGEQLSTALRPHGPPQAGSPSRCLGPAAVAPGSCLPAGWGTGWPPGPCPVPGALRPPDLPSPFLTGSPVPEASPGPATWDTAETWRPPGLGVDTRPAAGPVCCRCSVGPPPGGLLTGPRGRPRLWPQHLKSPPGGCQWARPVP